MLIAIDGPAGAGKSTLARALAGELGFSYLDSGAMYRAVALLAIASPSSAPGSLAHDARIDFDGRLGRTTLDGRDVTEAIRASEVAEEASRVAADPQVRSALVARQRELIADGDWVVEGRDIATVVAPAADLKIFLTATPRERARRRARELGADPQRVLAELLLRDERDRSRPDSPLRAGAGAVTIDTTELGRDAVLEQIANLARSASAAKPPGQRSARSY